MPTIKQKQAFDKIVENRGNVSKTMIEVGYDEVTAKNPKNLTDSKGWNELLQTHLSDELLSERHRQLLDSTHLEHMTFPLGPKTNEEKESYLLQKIEESKKKGTIYNEKDVLSDEDITELLESVNCTTRRFVHGDIARHVYFWGRDNKAIKDALDMAYKLKGSYAPDKSINVNMNVKSIDPTNPKVLEAMKLINQQRANEQ